MHKYIKISILIIISSISAYYAFIHENKIEKNDLRFNYEDTNEVSEIKILGNSYQTTILRIEDEWKVNELNTANNHMIRQLFRILVNLEMETLVPHLKKDSVVEKLKKESVRLILLKKNNIVKEYWIGGYDTVKKSTLIMDSKQIPAFVTAPGLSKDISRIIDPNPLTWRNKNIFGISPDLITEISYVNYENQHLSFIIQQDFDAYKLFNYEKKEINADESKLRRYISYYNTVEFSSICKDKNSDGFNSIQKAPALYSIKVSYQNKKEISLKIYPIKESSDRQQIDLNNVYVLINGIEPIYIVSYFQLDPILKDIHYFDKEL